MQRKSFGSMTCPIARSLERVGEWWSILILRDAFRGLTRFDQFQKSLDIAPNMLTRRLNALVESGLLERRAYSEHPPRHEYVLTERGRDLMPILGELARWGYEWAWSTPRSTEAIDLGAIFRLAPGLIDPAGMSGTVEFKIDGEGDATFTFALSDRAVAIEEHPSEQADARVIGDRSAWIRAFSPDRDGGDLAISGNRQLAEALLNGLAAGGRDAGAAPL